MRCAECYPVVAKLLEDRDKKCSDDAEKHLRELMMKVAVKTAEKYWSHPVNENIVAIVDEVLNEKGR